MCKQHRWVVPLTDACPLQTLPPGLGPSAFCLPRGDSTLSNHGMHVRSAGQEGRGSTRSRAPVSITSGAGNIILPLLHSPGPTCTLTPEHIGMLRHTLTCMHTHAQSLHAGMHDATCTHTLRFPGTLRVMPHTHNECKHTHTLRTHKHDLRDTGLETATCTHSQVPLQ